MISFLLLLLLVLAGCSIRGRGIGSTSKAVFIFGEFDLKDYYVVATQCHGVICVRWVELWNTLMFQNNLVASTRSWLNVYVKRAMYC